MKKLISIIVLLILTACSSVPILEETSYKVQELGSKRIKDNITYEYADSLIGKDITATTGSKMFSVDRYVGGRIINDFKATNILHGYNTLYFPFIVSIDGEDFGVQLDGIYSNNRSVPFGFKMTGKRSAALFNLKTGMPSTSLYYYEPKKKVIRKSNKDIFITGWNDKEKPYIKYLGIVPYRISGKKILTYELIYNGTDGNSIKIGYREYSGDDIARPAFFNEVIYNKNQSIITFKGFKIQIIKADNESIKFKVLSHELKPFN